MCSDSSVHFPKTKDLSIFSGAYLHLLFGEMSLHVFFPFSFLKIYCIFHFWLCCVFVAMPGLSLAVVCGFSLRWLLLVQSTGSRCSGFSSCRLQSLGHRLSKLWCTSLVVTQNEESSWSRDEPMSPALAGGFLAPGPPGKSPGSFLILAI